LDAQWEDVDLEEFGEDDDNEVPKLAMDPDESLVRLHAAPNSS
jgi:hypothetical protein